MPTSKRVLTKWRKEALNVNVGFCQLGPTTDPDVLKVIELNDRVLTMTQELLDQHLLREANKNAK